MVHVKVCGVRTVADALACIDLGASAIGLNFVDTSPRRVDVRAARMIADAVRRSGSKALVVGVVANLELDTLRALRTEASLDCLQLHGDEEPALLDELLPHAYKAIRVASEADVVRARAFPGDHILVDAFVPGAFGGTGATFDWSLVAGLATERRLTLAGGLTPENVTRAVRTVKPYCVDVASGVESSPGTKDLAKVRAFIEAAR